jgi:hypothetical protein
MSSRMDDAPFDLTAPNLDPNGVGDDTGSAGVLTAQALRTPSPVGRPPPRSSRICGGEPWARAALVLATTITGLVPAASRAILLPARRCAAAAAAHPPLTRPRRPPAPPWVLACAHHGARACKHPRSHQLPTYEYPAQRLPRGRQPRASRATAAERTAAASTPPPPSAFYEPARTLPTHTTALHTIQPARTLPILYAPHFLCTPQPSTPPTRLGSCPRTPGSYYPDGSHSRPRQSSLPFI